MNLWPRVRAAMLGAFTILALAAWSPSAFAQDTDSAPSPDTKNILNVAGDWAGTIDAGADGSGTISVALLQNGKNITGTFDVVLNGDHGGPLKGKVSGDHLNATLDDTTGAHGCKVKTIATVSGTDCPAFSWSMAENTARAGVRST